METVLATAILAAALAALGHQSFVGVRAAARMDLESRAAQLCHSRMETLLLQKSPSAAIQDQPIPGEPGWMWSAELSSVSEFDRLQWLTVRVFKSGNQAPISQYQLSRLISAQSGKETNTSLQVSRSDGAIK